MLKHALTRWIYRLMIESPKAHELLLRLYTCAEGFHHRFPWFNRPELVERSDLQLLMRQHFADEDNHAKYFKLALTLRGRQVQPIPPHLDYLVLLAAAFYESGILVGDTIEELTSEKLFSNRQNLFVQLAFKDLSEKRAITEFHIWRDLAKTREPETYAVLKRVVEDEDWHVKIFDEQVHMMMADPEHGPALSAVYKRLVKEQERIANLSAATLLGYMLDNDLLTAATPFEKTALRGLTWLQGLGRGKLPVESARQFLAFEDTKFYQASGGEALAAS
jgi:hypothetical protein